MYMTKQILKVKDAGLKNISVFSDINYFLFEYIYDTGYTLIVKYIKLILNVKIKGKHNTYVEFNKINIVNLGVRKWGI